MCGRVRLTSDYSEIKIRLKFAPDARALNFEADWNKPPTAPMLVAIRSEDGKRARRRTLAPTFPADALLIIPWPGGGRAASGAARLDRRQRAAVLFSDCGGAPSGRSMALELLAATG